MTATYSNQPGVRDVDTVRFEVSDTDTSAAKLTDEEIEYLVASSKHVLLAAAAAAQRIGAAYAASPASKQVGDLQVSFGASGRTGTYQELAADLRRRAVRKAASGMYAGGISQSDKDAMRADSDRVATATAIGDMDHDRSDGKVMDW